MSTTDSSLVREISGVLSPKCRWFLLDISGRSGWGEAGQGEFKSHRVSKLFLVCVCVCVCVCVYACVCACVYMCVIMLARVSNKARLVCIKCKVQFVKCF